MGFLVTSGEKKERSQTLADNNKPIPFSYELGHLLLHLLSLQLFVQQDLESCEAAVALSVFLVRLRAKKREEKFSEAPFSNKHQNINSLNNRSGGARCLLRVFS